MRAARAFLVVLAASGAAAQEHEGEKAFKFVQRVDCRSAPSPKVAGVPKNSVLMVFDDESEFGEPFKWVVRERAGLMRAIDQLLDYYDFPLKTREMSRSAAREALPSGAADIALDYWNNSFVVRVTEGCKTVGSTNVFPLCDKDDGCYEGQEVYGPELRHYAPDSCVQSIGALGGDVDAPLARKRAYLAAIIVHEVIHAAHVRVLGSILGSAPTSQPRDCPMWVSRKSAIDRTRALRKKLGIPFSALHMSHGLMTPGISLDGDPSQHVGGGSPNLGECLADKRLPAALFSDLRALASTAALCTDYDKPVSEFFSLPAENRRLIKLHLDSRLVVPCHSACYYKLTDQKVRLDR